MKSSISILIATIMMHSCATGNSKKNTPNAKLTEEFAPPPPPPENVVAMQTRAAAPFLSSYSDRQWKNLKNSDRKRDAIYGNLATADWQNAMDLTRKELEKYPGDPELFITLAAGYAGIRNYEMSGYYAQLVLKQNPSHGDALNFLGLRSMMSSGNRRVDYDTALNYFQRSADSDNSQVSALLNLGSLQLDLGDYGAASQAFERASSRCKRCYQAQYGQGVSQFRLSSFQQAKSIFESILSDFKDRADAQYHLALVYQKGLNDPKTAAKLLQEIVSDSDGRFRGANEVKRVANITLRRIRSGARGEQAPIEALDPISDGPSEN